jgi:hypothetical protein
MRAADLITASILILLGRLVIVDAMRLSVGWGMDGPKSSFFPFWLALIMMVYCAIIMAQQAHNDSPHFCGAGKVRSCQILKSEPNSKAKLLRSSR